MDPISHLAFGRTLIALARQGRSRRGTIGAAMLGSLAPDIDAVFMPFGWDRYLRAHEIGTHSLIGALACAAATAAVVWPARRDTRFTRLLTGAAIGTLSHLVLDIVSGARLRLFWPFADRHITVPLVAMADPILLTLLVVSVIGLTLAWRHRQPIAAAAGLTVVGLFLSVKGMLAVSAIHAYESTRP